MEGGEDRTRCAEAGREIDRTSSSPYVVTDDSLLVADDMLLVADDTRRSLLAVVADVGTSTSSNLNRNGLSPALEMVSTCMPVSPCCNV